MYALFAWLHPLFQPSPEGVQARDEAYLAQAVDMVDLERRMRQLDRGVQDPILPMPGGIFSR